MKVALISDTHGILMPPIDEDCDFIIHAGDIAPDSFFHDQNRERAIAQQDEWFNFPNSPFYDWLDSHGVPFYGTWGNHDFYGHRIRTLKHRGAEIVTDKLLNIHGLEVYFMPWITPIGTANKWAFEAVKHNPWEDIPASTQVLITHCPPWGMGDMIIAPHKSWGNYEHVGSKNLLDRIMELKDLRLVVCGHIHEGRGLYANEKLGFPVINCAVLTERYTPVNDPVVYIEWPTDAIKEMEGYGHGV